MITMSTVGDSPRSGASVGADARRDQPAMEALGVRGRVERDRVLGDAGHPEIVADAADAEDERVVRHGARRKDFDAVVVVDGVELEQASRAVEPGDGTLTRKRKWCQYAIRK